MKWNEKFLVSFHLYFWGVFFFNGCLILVCCVIHVSSVRVVHCFHHFLNTNKRANMDTFEYILLLYTFISFHQYIVNYHSLLTLIVFSYKHILYQQCKEIASRRKHKQRLKWSKFNKLLSDNQFRRYFRMDRKCFDLLCEKIINVIGEEKFMSEDFL